MRSRIMHHAEGTGNGNKRLACLLLLTAAVLLPGCGWGKPAAGTGPTAAGDSAAPGGGQAGAAGTVPAAADEFRFVVMGDSRGSSNGTNEATLRALLEKVKALKPAPDLILFTGDQVTGGSTVARQLADWKNIADDYWPVTSIYPALGNHEHDEKVFSSAFPHLPKEQLPGYGRTVYSFDHGNARFITLNSDRTNPQGQYVIDDAQLAYLEAQLKGAGAKHRFVQFHVPAYPVGAHLGSSLDAAPESRDKLWALLDRYRVTAVLVGHEHNYNRRKVDGSFSGSGYTFHNEIYQLTIGGAGAPLYTGSQENKGVVTGPKASYHYMVVDVEGGRAKFQAYDLQENRIDEFTVDR
ncbi:MULTISPECIES: metallophosphoesterase family protein [Paenibacillus]|uniref:metallophosphoesterase family protein n=1 Tax=Paenibacillus TaxID=44249 RepID=UPI0022B8D71B|nr:metallophosphoesterase [Paenibacillus caseinilyticus]MCZ8522508.1 metallophosphoesterase [Paenibacillus caseinilyticus]